MANHKIKIEIFESDPFSSPCCGPDLAASSPEAIEKTRQMLTERSQIVGRLRSKFEDAIQVEREIVSPRRWDYPEHVRRLMFDNERLPYIFINSEQITTGNFPSLGEFTNLIKSYLKNNKNDRKVNDK